MFNNIKDMICDKKYSNEQLKKELEDRKREIRETNKRAIIDCILIPRIIKDGLENGEFYIEDVILKAEKMFLKAKVRGLLDELNCIKEEIYYE